MLSFGIVDGRFSNSDVFMNRHFCHLCLNFVRGIRKGVTSGIRAGRSVRPSCCCVVVVVRRQFVVMARLCVINLGCHLVESAGICVILLLSLQCENCVLSLWCVSCRLSAVLD